MPLPTYPLPPIENPTAYTRPPPGNDAFWVQTPFAELYSYNSVGIEPFAEPSVKYPFFPIANATPYALALGTSEPPSESQTGLFDFARLVVNKVAALAAPSSVDSVAF